MKPIRTVLPLAVALLSAAPALSGGLQPPIVQPVAARLAFAEACPGVEAALGQLGRQGYAGFVLRLGAERARIEATGPDGVARSFGWSCGTTSRRALLDEEVVPPEGAAAGPGPGPDRRGAAPEPRVAGRDSSTSDRSGRDPAAPAGGATEAPGPDRPAPVVEGAPEPGVTPDLGGGATDLGGTPIAGGGGSDLGGGGGSVAPGQGGSGQGGSGGSGGLGGGGGCNDREDDENNARHDNCGHGNNAGGDDADNPGQGEGRGPAGDRGGDGPGLGGVGGQAAGGPGAGGQGGGQGGAPAAG